MLTLRWKSGRVLTYPAHSAYVELKRWMSVSPWFKRESSPDEKTSSERAAAAAAAELAASWQGLTLVHFSAQPEPF